jgi:hypothetical protein
MLYDFMKCVPVHPGAKPAIRPPDPFNQGVPVFGHARVPMFTLPNVGRFFCRSCIAVACAAQTEKMTGIPGMHNIN